MALLHTALRDHLPLVATGKVREIYALDEQRLLFVTTDRISGTLTLIVVSRDEPRRKPLAPAHVKLTRVQHSTWSWPMVSTRRASFLHD